MKQQDMNSKIRKAFENAAPDVLNSVLSDCREQKGTVIVMTEKNKVSVGKKIAAIAAALALIIGLGAGVGVYHLNNTAASTVSLDVNPSIEITVNRNEKVLKVEFLNTDGQIVLEDMDLKGQNIDLAVNAIIGSMVRKGYISDLANSILITVDSKDPDKGLALEQRLTNEINDILKTDGVTGAVIGQTMQPTEDLKDLAQKHDISLGKAQLIQRIIKSDPTLKFEELAKLSINQLKLLSESSNVKIEDVNTLGNASDKQYIGKDAALQTVLTHLGITQEQVTSSRIEMDYDDGVMVYEVEVCYDGFEYDYDIDAVNAQILSIDKEREHSKNPAPDSDGNIPSQEAPKEENLITPEAAVTAALTHAGLTGDQIRELDVDFERKNGNVCYEIDFEADGWEYDYTVSALDGSILFHEKERDDEQSDDDDRPVDTTGLITADEAKAAALKHAGLTESDIRAFEWELDTENGKTVYEIEFHCGNTEYSYEVDATNGQILHSEQEYDD